MDWVKFWMHSALAALLLFAVLPCSAPAQTELGAEDDLTVLGSNGTDEDPDAEIKGFTVFGSTQTSYTGAVAGPGNVVVNGVLAVSSGAYFVGNSTFTNAAKIFINDGSAGQILRKNAAGHLDWDSAAALGDNLGNHVATTTLQMGTYGVNTSSHVSAVAYQINGSTMVAILPGTDSIAYGVAAGASSTIGGNYNVFIGNNAGKSNTTGSQNTANGSYALYSNTTGTNNTATGFSALIAHQTGDNNTATGSYVLNSNMTGANNTATGSNTLFNNRTGANNTATGSYALYYSRTGSANAVFGESAGSGVSGNSFSSSTIMGYRAGFGLTTGSDNIFLGWQAGYNTTTGGDNIVLGYNQNTSEPVASNEMNIGGVLFGRLDSRTIGISTRAPQAALDIVSTGTAHTEMAQLWRASDGVIVGSMSATGVMQAVKFMGDGSGLTGIVAGDNLGDHVADKELDMARFPLINLSSITMASDGIRIATSIYAGASGIFISADGAITTTGVGLEGVTGNPRGVGAVDLQTDRLAAGQVASGMLATISGGGQNTSGGMAAVVAGGAGNNAKGSLSVVGGGSENMAIGSYSMIPGGVQNTAKGNYSWAGGILSSSTAQGAFTWSDSQMVVNQNDVPDRTVFKNRGGFLITGSTNPAMSGTSNRGMLVTGNGLVGISTGTPYAALDIVSTGTAHTEMAQLWRASDGIIVGSMSATGVMMASRFVGDGSGLTGITAGDNLGNHTATEPLKMGVYAVYTSSHVSATAYQINGSTVLALPNDNSIALGLDAGPVSHDGDSIFIGYRSGYVTSGGYSNIFMGTDAGRYNTVGGLNTFIGYAAGYGNSTGGENVSIGAYAGYSNNQWGGTYIGTSAGNNDIAPYNVFLGYMTGRYTVTGGSNTIVGYQAGRGASGYSYGANSFYGYRAGYSNTTGAYNTANGYLSLFANTSGGQNTANGSGSLSANTTGASNVANGYQALNNNTTGGSNVASGYQSMYANTTGGNNTATGHQALYSNTTGITNTANGYQALYFNTTGADNVATGSGLYSNTTGGQNTASGRQAGTFTQTGSQNAIYGYRAGYGVAGNSFSSSTIIGAQAGLGLTTGSDNIFLGWRAGYNVTTGTGNIVIGYNIGPSAATANNEINIGDVYKGSVSSGTAQIPKVAVQAADSGITLTKADFGKTITVNSASAQTITLPSVSSADIGAVVKVVKLGAGKVTIDAADTDTIADSGAGDTIYNNAATPPYASLELMLVTDTQWAIIDGNGSWITTD